MAITKKVSPPKTFQDFPIVGIGASAGGLDAFKKFLHAIPKDSGMAYVFVQHLDPTHESILPSILSRETKIPVNEIADDIHLAPNQIYVIPENKTLTSEDGVLKLTPRDKLKTNLVIDVFFSSLAEVHKGLAVGVVLSGMGKDGTLGLKAIKACGGFTFAQELESAAYNSMPKSAADSDVVDFVLPPEEIPGKLVEVLKSFNHATNNGDHPGKDEEGTFKQILAHLHTRSGVDFSHYKKTTIHRRLTRRLVINNKENLGEYLTFLRNNELEQDALFYDILIPVTSFFRDPEVFETLKKTIFPILLKSKPSKDPLRIWSAGCSTGEEALSIAICLVEILGEKLGGRQVQIFASDISEKVIDKARAATFSKHDIKMFTELEVKKYFTKVNNGFQLNKSIRDLCVFAIHNFIKDPPFAKMDLICCRNALIYMEPFIQKKALTNFHYALNKNGFLLLGKSETTSSISELFSQFSKSDKVFSPNPIKDRLIYSLVNRKDDIIEKKNEKLPKVDVLQTDFKKCAEAILTNKYTPTHVIINEQSEVVHVHGDMDYFIEPAQGKPSHNLIKIARKGLEFELRNAIHKAKTNNTTIIKEGILYRKNDQLLEAKLEIVPITNTVEHYYLVLFQKKEIKESTTFEFGYNHSKEIAEIIERDKQLEKELAQLREDMRSLSEDQEASNEELQSANEEFLSGNEELQSLNEELESSKEELQSTNEELIIVNGELKDKNEQIDASHLYAEAIIATLREPLVVLDKTLYIKTANAAFFKKFNIYEEEVEGILIYELQNRVFDNNILCSMLEKCLRQKTQLNDFEIKFNFPLLGECTMLLNARKIFNAKNSEPLILVSFEDITERKKTEKSKSDFSEELEIKVKERTLELEQTNIQLDQFAHTTSHEFQEPLRKIIAFSNLIQKDKGKIHPNEIKNYLNKIEEASIRMRDLIKDMLTFATIKHVDNLFVKTDLNVVLKNILFDFELLIEEKSAKVISHKLPSIEAIPFQMNQLFYDLIHNALKFAKPKTSPVIEISSNKLSKEELKLYPNLNQKLRYIEVIFKDNGIGFEQKYASKIFSMFQRLDASGTYAGTGIGLALCTKIVQGYSGEILAYGKENAGASFHILLPTHQPKKNLL